MAKQLPKSCFFRKANCHNPRSAFFPLFAQWQKPLIAQKNLYPSKQIVAIRKQRKVAITKSAKKYNLQI